MVSIKGDLLTYYIEDSQDWIRVSFFKDKIKHTLKIQREEHSDSKVNYDNYREYLTRGEVIELKGLLMKLGAMTKIVNDKL